MSIGQELLNVPMGDMIREMAFAIADGQYQLDENSINVAEMMGGLTTVYDEEGKVTFDDSRVFFGYEYMTVEEALAFAAVDDAITGREPADLESLVRLVNEMAEGISESERATTEIRVPVRHSMMELGFTPTFYQFVDTIIEVKIAIKITRESAYSYGRSNKFTSADASSSTLKTKGKRRRRRQKNKWKGTYNTSSQRVSTSQVDASYSSKYSYSAEGASILRTKITPVPPPTVLEDRIRSFMETEEERRQIALDARRAQNG